MLLEEIWSEYRNALKAFLHSKISNPADVEDLLQEILIKTHNNINTLEDESSIKSWLFQIANRTAIDFYRKKDRTIESNSEKLWYEQNEQEVMQELLKCIAPFIQALPEDSARLLNAVYIQDKSQKDYAEESDITYSTLKSQIQNSRKELKALFDQCCEYEIDKSGNLIDFNPKSDSCKNC